MRATVIRRLFTNVFVSIFVLILAESLWAGPQFRIIHTFRGGNDASLPAGALTFDSAGYLYGTSYYGGSATACDGYGCGTVFRLGLQNGHWGESVLVNFADSSSQVLPIGPLVFDSAGNIYGLGEGNGSENGQTYFGELFEGVNNGNGTYTGNIIHFFTGGSDGFGANVGLVQDSSGNLYGSTNSGGALNNNGVVFEFSPNGDGSWTETFPYTFGDGKNFVPVGSMVIDGLGNLYGTTAEGGAYEWGSVYRLSQSNGVWSNQPLYDFTYTGTSGTGPEPSGLVMDGAGNLYGTTQQGGEYGVGELFKLTPTAGYWRFTLIHAFAGSTDGGYPWGQLVIDSSGDIYGTTLTGGVFQYGTTYKFVHNASGRWTETVLHNFTNGADGSQPQGVVLDSLGNVYGIAGLGGANQVGVAYEIIP